METAKAILMLDEKIFLFASKEPSYLPALLSNGKGPSKTRPNVMVTAVTTKEVMKNSALDTPPGRFHVTNVGPCRRPSGCNSAPPGASEVYIVLTATSMRDASRTCVSVASPGTGATSTAWTHPSTNRGVAKSAAEKPQRCNSRNPAIR